MRKQISIVTAPLAVGNGLAGVETLPCALLAAGLAERLGTTRIVQAEGALLAKTVDRDAGFAEPDKVVAFLKETAGRIDREIGSGGFPVVLGGDCTILVGCLAAARRHASRGLLFVDAHTDFNSPGAPDYETASMDLAIVTGRGPLSLSQIDGPAPLVEDRNVVAFGFRDEAMITSVGGRVPRNTEILCLSLGDVRSRGFGNAARKALKRVTETGAPFWLHLDADAIDDAVLSAVDYRLPGGLSAGEVVSLIRRATATGALIGMDVTILNPTLDWDGRETKLMVDLISAALKP